MESRKITIVSSTGGQSKKVIMSEASTLGELKADLSASGIAYDNMDFFEGVSKTKLLADESALPTNVPYKGTTTNELVFMLSTTNKKIKSGASNRLALYARIKELNLQDDIKEEFGRNFTQVSTADLEEFISDYEPVQNVANDDSEETPCNSNLEQAFRALVATLNDNGDLDDDQVDDILEILDEGAEVATPSPKVPALESSYEEDELDEMLEFLG